MRKIFQQSIQSARGRCKYGALKLIDPGHTLWITLGTLHIPFKEPQVILALVPHYMI